MTCLRIALGNASNPYFEFEPASTRTALELTGVLTEQVNRLQGFIETGRPARN